MEPRRLLAVAAADMAGVVRGGHDWYLNTIPNTDHEIDLGFGLPGDENFFVGDWNGDGRETPGVARPHRDGGFEWLLDLDGDAAYERRFFFGLTSHTPIAGDFNGDGKTDVAAVGGSLVEDRTGLLDWYVAYAPFPVNTNAAVEVDDIITYGVVGDRPVAGDWNGDNVDDVGVISRVPVNGLQRWFLNGLAHTVDYGHFGDPPIVGDWDGDGDDDVGIVLDDADRNGVTDSLLTWHLADDHDQWPDITFQFGHPGDVAVAGRWDFPEISVFRNGTPFYSDQTIDFGNVRVGVNALQSLVVRNNGTRAMDVALTSSNARFAITDGSLVSPKSPGTEETFRITFSSTTLGQHSGQVQIHNSDANENPFIVNVRANVVDPEIQVDGIADGQSGVFDFGRITQDLPGRTHSFPVRNTGTAPLAIHGVSVPDGFVITQNLPSSIEPGDSKTLKIQLIDNNVGEKSGRVEIRSDDRNESVFDFPVRGKVIAAPESPDKIATVRRTEPLMWWLLDLDNDPDNEIDLHYSFPEHARFVGDWNGDGFETLGAVQFVPGKGLWWLLDVDGDADVEISFYLGRTKDFGLAPIDDIPVVGDFNGDGIDDVGVVRPDGPFDDQVGKRTLHWYIASDLNAPLVGEFLPHEPPRVFGFEGDRPVVGDWDGDGTDNLGIIWQQPVGGLLRWTVDEFSGYRTFDFGLAGEKPVVGDWDGNGTDNAGVVTQDRNRDGVVDVAEAQELLQWLMDTDGTPAPDLFRDYGRRGDEPMAGNWAFPEVTVDGVFSGQDTPLDFGEVRKGTIPVERTFTIRNDGNRPLDVHSLTVSGDFQIGNDLQPWSIVPGGEESFSIRLKDTATIGEKSGIVAFGTNDPNEANFSFHVKSLVRGPEIVLYPQVDFHHIRDGQSRVVQFGSFNQDVVATGEFTVLNTGNAPLEMGEVELPLGFFLIKAAKSPLAPGEFDSFNVGMNTDELRTLSGTVRFATNDLTLGDFEFPLAGQVAFNPLTSEIGMFENGLFFLDTNRDPAAEFTFDYGLPNDVPVVGDWDGDGDYDLGVVRIGDDELLHWHLTTDDDTLSEIVIRFGRPGDIPIAGDWDGDGDDDPGVVTRDGDRNGLNDDAQLRWLLDTNANPDAEIDFYFGVPGDRPVVGDINGDGQDDAVVTTMQVTCRGEADHLLSWCFDTNLDGVVDADFTQQFGLPEHTPVMGDWDGDGFADVGVVADVGKPLMQWYLDVNDDATIDYAFEYGFASHRPIVGRWLPGGRRATISGFKWHDDNANGNRDPNEAGLAGHIVYLDHNDDGVFDDGELSTTTDADGFFEFNNLRPGTYFVNTVRDQGFLPVFPRPEGHYTQGDLARRNRGQRIQASREILAEIVASASDQSMYSTPQDVLANSASPVDDPLRLEAFRADPRFRQFDGREFAVVVIDTGIDADHAAFGSDLNFDGVGDRIRYQYDFFNDTAAADDHSGHGSHVTSLAAGEFGTGGVAPAADIIHLKIFPDEPNGATSERLIEQALRWTIEHVGIYNIVAVNLSLASENFESEVAGRAIADELAALASLDVIAVAATGNHFDAAAPGVGFPAADPAVVAVGAVDASNQIAPFTQRKPGLIDVLAPGVAVRGADSDGGLTRFSGTSQAAPHVAGAAVLAQQLAKSHLGRLLTQAEFRLALKRSMMQIVDPVLVDANRQPARYPLLDVLAIAEYVLEIPPTNGNHAQKVDVGPADSAVGIAFGDIEASSIPQPQSRIRGRVFDDINRDGRQDVGEAGLAGQSVYLDLNDNRRHDSGEPMRTTADDGSYEFDELPADNFAVRFVAQAGRTSTTKDDLDLVLLAPWELTFPAGSQPGAVTIADFNADGWQDVATVETQTNTVAYWIREANGQLPQTATRVHLGAFLQPKNLVAADLNGDELPDLVVMNFLDDSVTILTNDGPTGSHVNFTALPTIPVGSQPFAAAIGDLVGDWRPDIAVINGNSGNISILENHGDFEFIVASAFQVGEKPRDLVIADFDNQMGNDLAVVVKGENRVKVLLSDGEGDFDALSLNVGAGPSALVSDDFNRDGWTDLAVANRLDDTVQILHNSAEIRTTPALAFTIVQTITVGADPSAPDEPLSLALGDFDEQGGRDLVTSNVGSDGISVLLAAANGRFSTPTHFSAAFRYGTEIAKSRVFAGNLMVDGGDEILLTLPQSDSTTAFSPSLTPGLRRVAITRLDETIVDVDFGSAPLVSVWQNPLRHHDVDNNGAVEALDVLMLINYLNAPDLEKSVPENAPPPAFFDVDADQHITPLDALLVINAINQASGIRSLHFGEAELGVDSSVPEITSGKAAELPSSITSRASLATKRQRGGDIPERLAKSTVLKAVDDELDEFFALVSVTDNFRLLSLDF